MKKKKQQTVWLIREFKNSVKVLYIFTFHSLEDLKILQKFYIFLRFNFIMIYIIYTISVSLEITWNTLKAIHKSTHKSNREKQVVLFMILNGEGWHYLTVAKLSALLIGITSKHKGDFFAWIALISLEIEEKTNLNYIKKYVKIKICATLWYLLKKLKY